MDIDEMTLLKEVDAYEARHPGIVNAAEVKYRLPHRLLYAVGSRETDLAKKYETTPGDNGHGHGTWQRDDRSHAISRPYTVAQQAEDAAELLRSLIDHFDGNVHEAIAAYNAGATGAARGHAKGNDDIGTTHRDYATDVVERMTYIAQHRSTINAPLPSDPPLVNLKMGARGDEVIAMQEALKVVPDGDWGPKTDKALRAFQKRKGLAVDGVLGPETRAALGL